MATYVGDKIYGYKLSSVSSGYPEKVYANTTELSANQKLYDDQGVSTGFQIKSISDDNISVKLNQVTTEFNFRYAAWIKAYYNANAPKKYIMISKEGFITYSNDGSTWSDLIYIEELQGKVWSSITYGNSKYVALSTTGYVSTSTDGEHWSTVTGAGSSSLTWNAITYDGTKFIAGSSNGRAITSTDGTTWSSIFTISIATGIFDMIYAKGKYICMSVNAEIITSTDFENWTEIDSTTAGLSTIGGGVQSLGCDGNLFYVFANNGKFSISSDGLSWETPVEIDTTMNFIGGIGIVYDTNKFLVLDGQPASGSNRQRLGRLYNITLGTWPNFTFTYTVQDIMKNNPFCNLVCINNKCIVFDYCNKISKSTDYGKTWSLATTPSSPFTQNTTWDFFSRIIYDGTQLVALSYGGSIYTSTDEGSTWTRTYYMLSTLSIGLCFNGTQYMKLNDGGYYSTSTDLVNWSSSSRLATFSGWADLIWTGTKFMAIASGGRTATSTDGTNWTLSSSGIGISGIFALKYYDGVIYAFGKSNNSYRAYSTDDGETWTTAGPLIGNASIVSSATGFLGDFMLVKDARTNKIFRTTRPDLL